MTETSCIISAMDVGDRSIGHVGSPIASCGKLCFNFKDIINLLGTCTCVENIVHEFNL